MTNVQRLEGHQPYALVGTIVILRLAKRGNIIPAIKPELDILIARDYRISKRIYDFVLKQEGEA